MIGKQLHWAVVGPLFRPLHQQLDEFVDAWRDLADVVAERAVALGYVPDGAPRPARRPSVIAMEALDGNAIAGSLFEYFGSEMTSVRGRCTHCGTVALIAELAVYTRAPGAVARCRTCGDVAMVLVNARGSMEFHAGAFEVPESA